MLIRVENPSKSPYSTESIQTKNAKNLTLTETAPQRASQMHRSATQARFTKALLTASP